MNITTVDFETKKITSALPPEPVGVSIKYNDRPSFYLAWGHKDGNNSSKEEATRMLADAYENSSVLFHNSSFDLAVAKKHLGLQFPKKVLDSLFQLYIYNPHAETLSLKPSAEKYLNWAPEERDIVHDWIMANVPGVKKKEAGGFVSEAPVDLVAPYAMGDTDRTYALYQHFKDIVPVRPFERECKLVKVLVDNTLEGIRIDLGKLELDFACYSAVRKTVEQRIFKKLKKEINLDSGDELADAIEAAGLDAEWINTPKGKRSTSKENLAAAIKDIELLSLLNYRGTLSTYLDTFYSGWLQNSVNGRIHLSWNQVRNQEQDNKKFMGTRTGRLSSTPSLLNVPKQAPEPRAPLMSATELRLPALPIMRQYLLPDENDFWLKRDYSAQELRILAHYENGAMMRAFNDNPNLDLHQMMSEILTSALGRPVSRFIAKTIAFSIIYGSGTTALAESLSCSYNEAQNVKTAYLGYLAGIKEVIRSIKATWDRGDSFKTWGGRPYYKEAPRWIKDKRTGGERWADFGYKGVNYLIQGSAADVTKEAILNYHEIKQDGRFLLTVHDEINISGPKKEMALLKEAMLDIKIDVPMLSEGKIGYNFGALEAYD